MEVEVTSTWIEATALLSSAFDAPTSHFEINTAIPGENIIDLITKFELGDILISWYIDHIRNYFATAVAPNFWKHFADFQKVIQVESTTSIHKWVNVQLNKAVGEIYGSVIMFESIRDSLLGTLQKSNLKLQYHNKNNNSDNNNKKKNNNIHFQPCEMLRVALFTEETNRSTFHKILFLFFFQHFVNFNNKQKLQLGPDSDDEEDASDDGDHNGGSGKLEYEGITGDQFAELCAKLHHLDLLVISEEIFTEILFDQIEGYISTRCKGKYNKSLMPKIQHWANVVLFEWLKLVICLDNKILHKEKNNKDDKNFRMFQQWKTRLEFNIYETFANLRIKEIFSLIVDFPESIPALQDLQMCLTKTSQHKHLVSALKKSNVTRLLHPGANTNDIIDQYISTIKAMRLIDPSGVILDDVGDPIRNYLRQREDTIRCIVTSFTTDDEAQHTELFEEFRRGKNRLDKNEGNDDDDDDEAGDGNETDDEDVAEKQELKQWQPDPLEASPSKSRHRKQDTIGMLVNIYGSSELFVNEYRNMLADRLIAITDYDVDKEVRNLELLKLRFEESSLHNCEIMLKDMADSKRTNALIKKAFTDKGDDLSLDVIIVSHLFWPTIKEESLTLPEPIQQQFDKYCKQYEHVKRTRQLNRKAHLGSVELELQFGGSSLPFTVSPAHAAIIYLFQDDQTTLNLDTIATKVGMAKDLVRKKLVYWVNMQILQEVSKDMFQLVERDDSAATGKAHVPTMMAEEEEETRQTPSATAMLEETMRVCENFILNMLANRGKCSLETIHTTLGFVLPNYSATPSDLKAFMQKLIREDKLELDGSEYAKK